MVNILISSQIIDELVTGVRSWHDLPKTFSAIEQALIRREALIKRLKISENLKEWEHNPQVITEADGANCEQMVGTVGIPVGIAGPMKINDRMIFVPIATTEGALVASVQRGAKATNTRGIYVEAELIGTTRSMVFEVAGIKKGRKLALWLKDHHDQLKRLCEETSNHLRFIKMEIQRLGKQVHLKFWFDTGEAMGMNMVSKASQAAASWIETQQQVHLVSLSGNGCVDKKPAFGNFTGRGHMVRAEAFISNDDCVSILKTTPQAITDVVVHKQWLGSMLAGSMGFNAHYANMVAGCFLACGQDMAHVVEGSLGITTASIQKDGLYFSVYLPALMVGTVGGGTRLPSQKASLSVLGLGNGITGERDLLAQYVGGTVLCGELSLTAALASGDLVCAHQQLGRKNHG